MGDFGAKAYDNMNGISYSAGDFVTPGTSGFGGISYSAGDYVTPGTSGFGNLLTNLLTPELKASAIESAKITAKEAVKYIWEEYKYPIMGVSAILIAKMAFDVYADYKVSQIARKL
jgi:hypothetical protein